jgi:hypothetical protein
MGAELKIIHKFDKFVKRYVRIILNNCNSSFYVKRIEETSRVYEKNVPSFERFLKEHEPNDHTY